MIESGTWVTLIKDCEALMVPSAMPITIPSGTNVQITQAKGGTVTVVVAGNLARINSDSLDALGIDLSDMDPSVSSSKHTDKKVTGPVNIESVWNVLKTCYDPEIPVNIVDLGLIYECKYVEKDNGKENLVEIKMTLTAPACAMGPVIVDDVKNKVLSVDNVTDVSVELVFDPPWDQSMMSDVAKLELGMF